MADRIQSTKDQNREEFLRMHKSLTDPLEKEKNKHEADRKKRREDRIKDTGLSL